MTLPELGVTSARLRRIFVRDFLFSLYTIGELMTACVALVLLAQQTPTRIPIGSDIHMVGRMRPGSYLASKDVHSLPKLSDLSKDKWATFSGNLYIVSADPKQQPQVLTIVNGKVRQFEKKTGSVTYTQTLVETVHSHEAKTDFRIAQPGTASFLIKLPDDSKRVQTFDGTLTFSQKDMKSQEALVLTLKKGKVTARMP